MNAYEETGMLAIDPLKHVKQKDPNSGCGIACIAMLARISYDDARVTIFGDQNENLYLWEWSTMRDALQKNGVWSDKKARRAFNWQHLKNAFLIVWYRFHPDDEVGHYVVYDPIRRVIHDPLKDTAVPVSRIRRRHPVSYLMVEPKPHALN
jgi:hypothetical protein